MQKDIFSETHKLRNYVIISFSKTSNLHFRIYEIQKIRVSVKQIFRKAEFMKIYHSEFMKY